LKNFKKYLVEEIESNEAIQKHLDRLELKYSVKKLELLEKFVPEPENALQHKEKLDALAMTIESLKEKLFGGEE
jgi:hypothetical protein